MLSGSSRGRHFVILAVEKEDPWFAAGGMVEGVEGSKEASIKYRL